MHADERHMRAALELAERGRGTTDPNPVVGCVVVRDGTVVGRGWHERAGGPHAEVVALRDAGPDAAGATVYVTLEPCDHRGRTGPCTTALIEAGVDRVVYAAPDPHPRAGGGADTLRAAGVRIDGGVLAGEAERQNEVFLTVERHRRPFVTLKLAQSLDGRVTVPAGSGRWVTSEAARTRVHELRGAHDAVLVGSGTVLADDPRLDVRHVHPPGDQPRPAVLDARGRTPTDAAVVRDGALLVTTRAAPDGWRRRLRAAGAEVVVVDPADGGGVDLPGALAALLDRGVRRLLCEGGPTVAGALVSAGAVDRLVLHVAPTLIGDRGLPALAGPAPRAGAGRWRLDATARYGPDLELDLRAVRGAG